jgi:hypothetical protein
VVDTDDLSRELGLVIPVSEVDHSAMFTNAGKLKNLAYVSVVAWQW